MLEILAMRIGVLAFVAWAPAALHALLLLSHRREEPSIVGLALDGHRFFSSDTWKRAPQRGSADKKLQNASAARSS